MGKVGSRAASATNAGKAAGSRGDRPSTAFDTGGGGRAKVKINNGIARGTHGSNSRINPLPIPHVTVVSVGRGETSLIAEGKGKGNVYP